MVNGRQYASCRVDLTRLSLFRIVLLGLFIPALATASPITYVVSHSGQFGTVDLGTGAYTQIGMGAGDLLGLGEGTDGALFSYTTNNQLVTINPLNGAETVVGNGFAGFSTFSSLGNGELFGLDFDNNLYRVDPLTGRAILIGPTGLPTKKGDNCPYADSLSGSANVLYYTLQLGTGCSSTLDSTLFRIDPATGATTVVGPTGVREIEGTGFVDQQLYGFSTSFQNGKEIYLIDTSTGKATIDATQSASLDRVFGAVELDPPAAPEPGTAGLLALGLLLCGIAARSRIRRRR